MPTKNRISLANDKEDAAPGRDSKVSWPFIWAGVALVALAAVMYVAVALYRPAQAATDVEPVKNVQPIAPQPTAEPPQPPPAEPRSVTTPETRELSTTAPRPKRRKRVKAAEPPREQLTTARIEVSTHPGGYPIFINGRRDRETTENVRVIDLTPGPHHVEIQFPNGMHWSRDLYIPPGCIYSISLVYSPPTIEAPVGEVETVDGGEVEIAALGRGSGMSAGPDTFARPRQAATVDEGTVSGTVCATGAYLSPREAGMETPSGMVGSRGGGRPRGARPAATPMPTPVAPAQVSPQVREGPRGTRPAVIPTPTPVTPAPAPAQVRERDMIVARYPQRLLTDKDSTLRVEMSRVLGKVVAGTMTMVGKVEIVDTPDAVAGAADPEATLAWAFGPGYEAFATVTLISQDLVTKTSPQPERLLGPKPLEWEWQVRPKEGVAEVASFAFQIDVVWRGEGLPEHRRTVWLKEIKNVPVGLPEGLKVLQYGSPATGFGGGGAMVAGVFKKRRRKRPGESNDEGADEPAAAPPPASATDTATAAAAAMAATAAPPAPPAPVSDEVHCTVYAPPEARPGDMLKVQVFAHLEEQAELLAGLAAGRDEDAREGGSEALKGRIERGKELTFTLDMPGLKVKEAERSLVWNGEPDCVRFTVTVPDDCKPKVVWGTVEILYGSVPVGEVEFKFKVVADAAVAPVVVAPEAEQSFVRFTKAFISYSRKDSEMVLEKVQMLEAQGVECYLDMMTFRSGEDWKQMINHYIDLCDVFFLFWSSASKSSPEVDKEIRYALERREKSAPRPVIKPIPIEGPPVVTPPPYLSHLHFDDRYRYFIKAKQGERLGASERPPEAPGAA